jgi:O-glycosyl hydrolase
MAKRMKVRNYNVYSEDMASCMSYCLSIGIKIYMLGSVKNEHKIQVNNNGKITTSPEAYSITEATDKIWELYCHFYKIK